MKPESGKPYTKPSGKPTFRFDNGQGTVIDVYENMLSVEVFQTTATSEQRTVMQPGDFDNFYSLLTSNGFKVQ